MVTFLHNKDKNDYEVELRVQLYKKKFRVDLYEKSTNTIYEFKSAKKAKDAIGQILVYSLCEPTYKNYDLSTAKLIIVLFDCGKICVSKKLLQKVVKTYNLKISIDCQCPKR